MDIAFLITVVCFALHNVWTSYPLFTRIREALESKLERYSWGDLLYYPLIGCPVCMPFIWGWFFTDNLWIVIASSGIGHLFSLLTE